MNGIVCYWFLGLGLILIEDIKFEGIIGNWVFFWECFDEKGWFIFLIGFFLVIFCFLFWYSWFWGWFFIGNYKSYEKKSLFFNLNNIGLVGGEGCLLVFIV